MADILNLENLFVYTFAGDSMIFLGIALIFIAGIAAKLKMPSPVFLMLYVLFAILMAQIATWFYAGTMLLVALVVYFVFGRYAQA